jgi:hypothetical protein
MPNLSFLIKSIRDKRSESGFTELENFQNFGPPNPANPKILKILIQTK